MYGMTGQMFDCFYKMYGYSKQKISLYIFW